MSAEVGGPLAESTKDKWAPGKHSVASLDEGFLVGRHFKDAIPLFKHIFSGSWATSLPRKVLDQATELYFKYDSAGQKTHAFLSSIFFRALRMYCWNTSQGLGLWKL